MRHFLSIKDVEKEDLLDILSQAELFKQQRPEFGRDFLQDKFVAILFEKPSTRTRVSFEVGINEMGGKSIFLSSFEVGLGKREAIKDVARTLSRYVHLIVVRTFLHDSIRELSNFSSVPVVNALTDYLHPCQALADVFTIKERFGSLDKRTLCFIGDFNNVFRSLAFASAKFGMKMIYSTPKKYRPDDEFLSIVANTAKKNGFDNPLALIGNPAEAVRNADIIYTDVWASMGQESEQTERKKAFVPYQINDKLLNEVRSDAVVMHCLPAHRGEEITDSVIEGPRSIVFDQAENRLHVQKAVLNYVLR